MHAVKYIAWNIVFRLMATCHLAGHLRLVMPALTHPSMRLAQENSPRAVFVDLVPTVIGMYIKNLWILYIYKR
jgi:hypothetical protein